MSMTKYGTRLDDVAKTAEGRQDAEKAAEAVQPRKKPNPQRDIPTERIEVKRVP